MPSRQTLTLPAPGAGAARRRSGPTTSTTRRSFLWSIAPSGVVTPLTPAAPRRLPARRWDTGPGHALGVGTSTFRFDALRTGGTLLVAGQSVASAATASGPTLLIAELVFGVILAVAVFAGATVVGLRASAPSELVRRRQAEFTADASHELRTPISVIEAEVGLALDRPRDPDGVPGRCSSGSGRRAPDCDRSSRTCCGWRGPTTRPVRERRRRGRRRGRRSPRPASSASRRWRHGRDVALSCDRGGARPVHRARPSRTSIDRLAGVLIDNACKFAGEGGRVEVERPVDGRAGRSCGSTTRDPGSPRTSVRPCSTASTGPTTRRRAPGWAWPSPTPSCGATPGHWDIGVAELGGARMEVSWRRVPPRRGQAQPPRSETLSKSLA